MPFDASQLRGGGGRRRADLQAVTYGSEGCIHLVEMGVVIDVQYSVDLWEVPP